MVNSSLGTVDPGAVDLEPPADAATAPWWRRRWPWLTLLVIVVLIAAGIGVRGLVYIHTFQPLQPGGTHSVGGLHAAAVSDGVHDTEIIVTGGHGTQARVAVSIWNDSSHDVQLLGLPRNSGIDRMTWGPIVSPNGQIGGGAAHGRSFPATLRAGHQLSLWIYLTQPNCANALTTKLDDIPIRWRAYRIDHEYDLSLTDGPLLPVVLCAPAKASHYINR